MKKLKIAVPTKAYAGLDDVVSDIFGKTKTFTLVDVENDQVKKVHVIDNPEASYDYGCGPVAAKTLADLEVDLVVTAELGPGASGLLEHHNIRKISVQPGTKVVAIIKDIVRSKPE